MTVTGSLVFQSAATYLVQVDPTISSASVTTTATLGGATVDAVFAPGTYVAKQYTILTATGGVNGTFGSVTNTNLPSGFQTSMSYDANHAFLDLALGFQLPTGLDANQHGVANALTNSFNAAGGIPMVYGALTPRGLTIAAGELGTSTQQTTFDAMNLFTGLLTDPFVAGRGDGLVGAADHRSAMDRRRRARRCLCAGRQTKAQGRTRRLCRAHQEGDGPGTRSVAAALERLGRRVSRLADH